MVDLQTILQDHRPKNRDSAKVSTEGPKEILTPSWSEIPDLFFDQILVEYKLSRMEIMVIMYLYRRVWCRANLYKVHGISQLMSHTEMGKTLGLAIEEIYHALRTLEEYGFITTVRSGQYFVRRYFTKRNDEHYGQTYDDFEV